MIRGSRDRQHTGVVRLVAGSAAEHEVQSIVAATVGAVNDMVQLEGSRRSAASYAATSAVATPHEPRDARRNVLVRPLGCGAIDRSDVLCIAHRTVDRRRVDGDPSTAAFLPALTASLAHGHGDLVPGAAGGLGRRRAVQEDAAQLGDEGIIGQVGVVLVIERRAGLPQQREGLGR
jgi:hypothetical protein